jgi:hypothetical protein
MNENLGDIRVDQIRVVSHGIESPPLRYVYLIAYGNSKSSTPLFVIFTAAI